MAESNDDLDEDDNEEDDMSGDDESLGGDPDGPALGRTGSVPDQPEDARLTQPHTR